MHKLSLEINLSCLLDKYAINQRERDRGAEAYLCIIDAA